MSSATANTVIRPATLEDSAFLWRLAMEPSVRAMSTRSEEFSFFEHERWYREKLDSPLNAMWIMEADEQPVGQIRYGKAGLSQAEIAVSVHPDHRGHGHGTALIKGTEGHVAVRLRVTTLVALVLFGNEPSLGLFRSCGFLAVAMERRMGKQHVRFEKRI